MSEFRNQKSEIEIFVKAFNVAAGTDTTPTMKKDTKCHILYQNNNMLLQKKNHINKKCLILF